MSNTREAKYTTALEFGELQVKALTEQHPDFFPIYTVGGKWHHGGELWTDWTGGFLAGMMWQFQQRTGSDWWQARPSITRDCSNIGSTTARCTTWASSF